MSKLNLSVLYYKPQSVYDTQTDLFKKSRLFGSNLQKRGIFYYVWTVSFGKSYTIFILLIKRLKC
jgi:hypothetical protein